MIDIAQAESNAAAKMLFISQTQRDAIAPVEREMIDQRRREERTARPVQAEDELVEGAGPIVPNHVGSDHAAAIQPLANTGGDRLRPFDVQIRIVLARANARHLDARRTAQA